MSIYIVSTTVAILALVFSIIHFRRYCLTCMVALFLLAGSQLFWYYIPDNYSDALYDIAIIFACICIIKSRMIIKRISAKCMIRHGLLDIKKGGNRWYDKINACENCPDSNTCTKREIDNV